MARLLMLAVCCLALSVSLSGCAFFSTAFWQCVSTGDEDACHAFNDYLVETPDDRDGDDIANSVDECPDGYGTILTHGCPDRDGDQVADRDDACPDVAGTLGSPCPVAPPPPDPP